MRTTAFRKPSITLPPDPRHTRISDRDDANEYLRREEERLAGFAEDSFDPPLERLKRQVRSIVVDPSRVWSAGRSSSPLFRVGSECVKPR